MTLNDEIAWWTKAAFHSETNAAFIAFGVATGLKIAKADYGARSMQQTEAKTAEAEPIEPMMQFFEFAHLPEHLQVVSAKFYELACSIVAILPRNPERTVALRKLLESKDCAVRARLFK